MCICAYIIIIIIMVIFKCYFSGELIALSYKKGMYYVYMYCVSIFVLLLFFFYGVHPLRTTTTSSSSLNVGFTVAEEANA